MKAIRKFFLTGAGGSALPSPRLLLHLLLLLLYGWTLTETVPLSVLVSDERCIARWGDRTSQVDCAGLAPGAAGLYLRDLLPRPLSQVPLDWLALPAVWQEVFISGERATDPVVGVRLDDQQRLTGLLRDRKRFADTATTVTWRVPVAGSYTVEAHLRRPDRAEAGILLLQPGGDDGWLFLVDSAERRGTWWRWRDGRPAEPLHGSPYQKPLLAQAQSLLRHLLLGYLGSLLLWLLLRLVAWLFVLLARAVSPFSRLFRRKESLLPAHYSFTRPWLTRWAVIPFIWLAFASSLWITGTILERLPHVQDSITYLFQAQTLARGHVWAPAPPQPQSFGQEFMTVYNGKWFGQYAPGFPALLALGVRLTTPWLINPLLAALTVPLLYMLGRELYDHPTGLLTVVLVVFSPFFLFLSGSLMVHPAELFWVTLFLVSGLRALQPPFANRWAAVAGGAIGMLFLTRQVTALAVALPFLTLLLLGTWARLSLMNRHALWCRLGLLLVSALPFLFLLLTYQYLLTGSPWQDPRLLSRPFDRPGFGLDIGERPNAFTLVSLPGKDEVALSWYTDPKQPPRGHSVARGLFNIQQNWQALALHLFGWPPLFTFAFCWLLFFWGRPSFADWLVLGILPAVVGVYLFYWADGIMYGPRYLYAALPVLLILTARGIQMTHRAIGGAGNVLLALVLLLLFTHNWTTYLPAQLEEYRGYNFVDGEARQQIESALTTPALVFVPANDPNWWEYGRFFSGNTPWLDGPVIYARDRNQSQNTRLRAHFPGRMVYRWLPDARRLQSLLPEAGTTAYTPRRSESAHAANTPPAKPSKCASHEIPGRCGNTPEIIPP